AAAAHVLDRAADVVELAGGSVVLEAVEGHLQRGRARGVVDRVNAGAAVEVVGACAAVQEVVAAVSADDVRAGASAQPVVSRAGRSDPGVVSGAAEDRLRAEDVVPLARLAVVGAAVHRAPDAGGPAAVVERVVAGAGDDRVGAVGGRAHERVVAVLAALVVVP